MVKKYTTFEIEILLLYEEVVRTSPNYGNDDEDNWGTDIWD